MPAKASELERVARKLGFEKVRQKGSHARWQHEDGRATTIPIHGKTESGTGCLRNSETTGYHRSRI